MKISASAPWISLRGGEFYFIEMNTRTRSKSLTEMTPISTRCWSNPHRGAADLP